MTLLGVTPWGAQSDFAVPGTPIEWCCMDDGLIEVTFGAVSKDATGVEVRPTDGGPSIRGTIAPLPPSMPFDFDLFFIEGTAGMHGEVAALGLEGTATPESSVAAPRADEVLLSGSLFDRVWTARFVGSFVDGSACIHAKIADAYGEVCPKPIETSLAGSQPSLHGIATDYLYLLAGSVPLEVDDIRFASDDGNTVPSDVQCEMGPSGWSDPDKKVCAIALPTEGSGTLEYLDSAGNVLFEEGLGWGSATAASNEYPWNNEDTTITAHGSFLGAEWKLEVLYYLEGYRLTIDGRKVFEGVIRLEEPVVFPLFEGEGKAYDAIVLVPTGTQVRSVSVESEGVWEGRWVPGSTANGGEARLWILELPGAGTGSLVIDGVDQGSVTWP
jgi:hypothetical protein